MAACGCKARRRPKGPQVAPDVRESCIMNNQTMTGIEACVFDAYGTLFDVSSVAHGARDELGEQWLALSDLWRTKQLQYTWLRGLAGHHADFW